MQPKVVARKSVLRKGMFELDKDDGAKSTCCILRPWMMQTAKVVFLLGAVAATMLGVIHFDKLQYAGLHFLGFISEAGILGVLLLVMVNILSSVVLLPSLLFTLASGFLYGVPLGTLIVSVSCTLSAVLSFLISRYLARSLVERTLGNGPRFAVLDRAIRDEGFKLVLLLRLPPLHPYVVFNYLFGLTSISVGDFALATVHTGSCLSFFPFLSLLADFLTCSICAVLGHVPFYRAGVLFGLRPEKSDGDSGRPRCRPG